MDNLEKLKELLRQYERVAVAFSGGVDSSFLLKIAYDTLGGQNVLPITVKAAVNPECEMEDAESVTRGTAMEHIFMNMDVMSIGGFRDNPPDRCYHCKKAIFGRIKEEAAKYGIEIILDGTNSDDDNDYRPGMKALKELGVKSPLKECGLGKSEIREYSRQLGLGTWDKPSMACLASRIPYNESITLEKLKLVEKAEMYLQQEGFRQFRVRCHGNIARIEIAPAEMPKILDLDIMKSINDELKAIGFSYVTLDMQGYRTGSLNETLGKNGMEG